MSSQILDCIVIGAGFAGLNAARHLTQKNKSFLVLEARNRIGGRACTISVGSPPTLLDIGAQWIGPGQTRALGLAKTLGVDLFPTYDTGRSLLEDKTGIRQISGTTFLDPVSQKEFVGAIQALDELAQKLRKQNFSGSDLSEKLNLQSAKDWVQLNLMEQPARDLLLALFSIQTAANPDQVSMLSILYFIASCGLGLEYMSGVTDGALQYRFVHGTSELAQKLAAPFRSLIHLNTEVIDIRQEKESVFVTSAHGTIQARSAVLAIPPMHAARIQLLPRLRQQQALERFQMGSVIKCVATYPKPFWRDAGLSGQASSTGGPVISICDNSPPSGNPGVLVGFVVGKNAEGLSKLSEQARRLLILQKFADFFGNDCNDPIDFAEHAWHLDPWSKGGFFGFLPVGGAFPEFSKIWQGSGRVVWAGTETATQWMGFIEGALESGERAAGEVLQILKPIP